MRSQVTDTTTSQALTTKQPPHELSLIAEERDRMPWLSRKDALEQGFLVDVSWVAQAAGYRFPVALTRALWRDVSAVPESLASRDFRGIAQTPDNRLWHLLLDLASQIDRDSAPDETDFSARVLMPTADPAGQLSPRFSIRYRLGFGDDGEVVATILRPGEEHYLPGGQSIHPTPLSTLPSEALLITDSQEADAVRQSLGIHPAHREEFDGFAVLAGDGDFSAAWGFTGFPYGWKSAFALVRYGRSTPRLQALQKP